MAPCSAPCTLHVASPARYCHPCKGEGVRTLCGLNGAGTAHTLRGRIGGGTTATVQRDGTTTDNAGKIVNLCERHAATVTVARALVSGTGHAARQIAECVVFDAEQAASLADRIGDLTAARDRALDMITPDLYAKIVKASRYGKGQTNITSDLDRDARYDMIMDDVAARLGARAFRGDVVDVARVVEVACYGNTSAARTGETVHARLDSAVTSNADSPATLGDVLADTMAVRDDSTGWRIGGMTVSQDDMSDLIRAYPDLAAAAGL